jgi:hypothetical protein
MGDEQPGEPILGEKRESLFVEARDRVISSTAPNGSSKRKTGGLSVSVRANDARIRMPPDNAFG